MLWVAYAASMAKNLNISSLIRKELCHDDIRNWNIVASVPKFRTRRPLHWRGKSITNKMQLYSIFFIIFNALHVSSNFSVHHQKLKNCAHRIGKCQVCLLLPLTWVSSNLPTLTVAASKLDIYPMLCAQFLSSWWWSEKPPETYRALTVIKKIVKLHLVGYT
jgi:hypothetical protein